MPDSLRLDTPRLALRPLTAADEDAFFRRLVCDPVVMAFYHAYAAPMTEGERRARARRDFFTHFEEGWSRFGYVCWAITARAPATDVGVASLPPGELLGWAGIVTPALDAGRLGPELAYMVARSAHGQGVATEAAEAVLVDAYARYALTAVHAVVDTPNLASIRVLQKLGFRNDGQVSVYGSDAMTLFTHRRGVPRGATAEGAV